MESHPEKSSDLTSGTPSFLERDQAHLSIRGLRKAFGDNVVLKQVSLEVDPGEVVAFIGPSGAGKSTLLRCLNYLEMPSGGEILLNGKPVAQDPTRPTRAELLKLRREVGMVFQTFNLFPHMSVRRNVSLAQERILGRSKEQADSRTMELLSRVGLKDKAESKPPQCSGGQQQRIAIARSLALDPSIMLFDEPTSALDPELGAEVLQVMRELASGGMTMLVVTHEMSFAQQVSNRTFFMADAGIVESGPPEQIFNHPQHERTQKFLKAVIDR